MTAVYADSVHCDVWPTYSARQLNQYFKTIRLPSRYLQHPIIKYKSVKESTSSEALRVLKYLVRYQIANIPFENLELHYSNHHSISVKHEHLFHKMVERKTGRGGHCTENTYLFVTVLHSLGYDVTPTGARVNSALQPKRQNTLHSGPSYDKWNHMVAIVTIASKKYLIDVGFGNNSLTYPVPLEDAFVGPSGRPMTAIRLHRESIPDSTFLNSPVQLLWVYFVRFGLDPDAPWIPAYCFGDTPFVPQDFEAIGSYASKSPKSWFTSNVVCMKALMDKDTEEIIGDITLNGQVIKERRSGLTKVLMPIQSEKDRITALHKFLGVRLSEKEKRGILESSSMIA